MVTVVMADDDAVDEMHTEHGIWNLGVGFGSGHNDKMAKTNQRRCDAGSI